MSASLTLFAIWAVLATVTALLPMRLQILPGSILLLCAPVLIGFIGYQHGVWIALLGLLAFLSLFRRPLVYLSRKALGRPARDPRQAERNRP